MGKAPVAQATVDDVTLTGVNQMLPFIQQTLKRVITQS
ncbi:hypothetical protein Q7S_10350 [Rahnella aquatilis HX2]|jgi:hypothetical protein|nr:hypothetical protein Q7S_10350 [Rahnella aquatilis HX2]